MHISGALVDFLLSQAYCFGKDIPAQIGTGVTKILIAYLEVFIA